MTKCPSEINLQTVHSLHLCVSNLLILTCHGSSVIVLQLKYRKGLNKMNATTRFHTLSTEDNLSLKNAQKINKLVSEVRMTVKLTGLVSSASAVKQEQNKLDCFSG